MPPDRTHARPDTETRATHEERQYATALAALKAEFREAIQDDLRRRTQNPKIRMRWSVKGYAFGIVCRARLKLLGWPWYMDIPFANLSDIPGGYQRLYYLYLTWKIGILRFEPATDEEVDLARRNPKAVLPGAPLMRPAPWCWGPLGTNQMGRAKANGVSLLLKKPKRGKRMGPISPKVVLDSDVDVDDEVPSDDE